MVWLGKKFFDMRHKLSVKRKLIPEDEEKPFLDHLEDLRQTLTKIIATLLIGMVACFIFKEEIFKIIEYPINAAEIGVLDKEKSPLGLKDVKEWPQVTSIAYGLLGLNESQRATFLAHAFTPESAHLKPVVDALLIRHATLSLPETTREAYIAAATAGNAAVLDIVRDMEAKKVDASFERGPKHMNLRFFKPGEGFNLSMKLSLYAGIVIGFPLLLYFLLEFIVPGLRPEERRVLWPSLATGFGLFLIGVCFAYFSVTPNALRFLYNYDLALGGTTEYRFTDYASFVVSFTLIFGLCFELPVIVYALNKLGILSYELMKNTRSYAIIIIVVIAALLTPTTDLVNLSLLAVPMIFLYEVSIWIAYFHDKGVKKREAEEEAAERARREARRASAAMAAGYLDAPAGETPSGDHASGDHASGDPASSHLPSGVIPAAGTEARDPYHEPYHDPYHDPHPPFDHDPAPPADAAEGTLPPVDPESRPSDASAAGPPDPVQESIPLTGEPAAEADSYKDRAEKDRAENRHDTPSPHPPTANHTPGEPSEESRRHSD